MRNISVLVLVATIGASVFVLPNARAWTSYNASLQESDTIRCRTDTVDPTGKNWGQWCSYFVATISADSQETDGVYDYYQIVVRLYDQSYGINGDDGVDSFYLTVTWQPANSAGGVMRNEPQSNWYAWQYSVSLSYSFLSTSIWVPTGSIKAAVPTPGSTMIMRWDGGQACLCSTFNNYAEFGVDLALPEGTGTSVTFQTSSEHFHYDALYPFVVTINNSGSLVIPNGHTDPVTGGGGGGCFRCWRN